MKQFTAPSFDPCPFPTLFDIKDKSYSNYMEEYWPKDE